MKNLVIAPTTKSPEIKFNIDGELSISGVSIPEDAIDHYVPIFNWLEEFKNTAPSSINLNIKLEYMNTSSSLVILKFLKNLLSFGKKALKITWTYDSDDEDIFEQIEIIRDSIQHPIEMISSKF